MVPLMGRRILLVADPLNLVSVPLSSYGNFSPFGMDFDEDGLGKEDIVGGSVKIEGIGDSTSAFDFDVGAMGSDNRIKFFRSQKPYNASSVYHKTALNLGVFQGIVRFHMAIWCIPQATRIECGSLRMLVYRLSLIYGLFIGLDCLCIRSSYLF